MMDNLSRLRFGLNLPTFAGAGGVHRDSMSLREVDWNTSRKIVLECEKLGYDSVWLPDHLIVGRKDAVWECWTMLSALASITKKIRLGTLTLCNLCRHPQVLAKQAATLDIISGGRLEFGYGAGSLEAEHTAYGLPFPKPSLRIAWMKEAVEVIKRLWTEESVSYEGRYFKLKNAVCEPKPLQKPHPPVWIGGYGDKLIRAAAEVADGWNWALSLEVMRDRMNTLGRYCDEIGRDFKEIKKSWDSWVIIAPTEKEVEMKIRKLRLGIKRAMDEFNLASIDEYKKISVVGTPEECAERVQLYKDIDITHFMFWFLDYPDMEGIRTFAKEVIPQFK